MTDKIRIYVENSFSALPRTKEVTEIKQNIIENMEERYEALLAEGKSQNEAFGAVISEFGSMDDILQELNLEEDAPTNTPGSFPVIPEDFRLRYEQFHKMFAIAVAAGVICCILAIIIQQILEFFFGDSPIAIIGFFTMIALGVGIFILFGIQKSYYEEEMKRYTGVSAEPSSYTHYHSKRQSLSGRLCGTIMLTATAIFLLLGFLLGLWNPGWVVFPIGGILCGIVGVLLGNESHSS